MPKKSEVAQKLSKTDAPKSAKAKVSASVVMPSASNGRQFYIYKLMDPRTELPFYIGKGMGDRINQHEKEAKKGVHSRKCALIREIISVGAMVGKEKIASFDVEQDAYDFETKTIMEIGLGNLTNVMPGGQTAWIDRQAIHKRRENKKAMDKVIPKLKQWIKVFDARPFGSYVPNSKNPNLGNEIVDAIRDLVAQADREFA